MEQKNLLMGILCYLGPLVIIPLIVAKDDPFVKFHAKQGLVLLVIEIIIYALGMFLWPLFFMWWYLAQLLNLAVFVLSIVGIVNVANRKEAELPVVGNWGKSFNF